MAGSNAPKASSNKPSSSSSSHNHRKSRWESGNNPPTTAAQKSSPSKPPPQQKPSKEKQSPIPSPNPNSLARPGPGPGPFPDGFGPPPLPPPSYGFHMLDRRTIVLADGSVRSYFALPPDYQDFAPPPPRPPMDPAGRLLPPHGGRDFGLGFDRQFPSGRPVHGGREDHYRHQNQDYWNSLELESSHKRKYGDEGDMRDGREGNDGFARQRQQLLQYGNAMSNPKGSYAAGPSSPFHLDEMRAAKYMRGEGEYGPLQGKHNVAPNKHNEVDQARLKRAFLNFVRMINENANQKKKYLADGKQGSLLCVACSRSSKDFPDMHSLVMHAYNSDSAMPDQVLDHLGLHKALCILMGWNYLTPPDNSKAYQLLSAEEAAANQNDLIMWPPHVIIQNTVTGKSRDGRMEGLGNKAMDIKLRDLGFSSGKSKSMYGREGHMGATAVKFAGDQSGLEDALRLADFFEKENRGRRAWASVQSLLTSGKDEENNPNIVKLDKKTGEKERVLYGYLGTAFDLDNLDFDTRKKVVIESRRELKPLR